MRLRSIEQKIFLLILPICLVPPVLFLLLLGLGARMTFENAIGATLDGRAEDLAGQFDSFLAQKSGQWRELAAGVRSADSPTSLLGRLVLARDGAVSVTAGNADSRTLLHQLTLDPAFKTWTGHVVAATPIPPEGLLGDWVLTVPGQAAPVRLALFASAGAQGTVDLLIFPAASLIQEFKRTLSLAPESFLVFSRTGELLYPEYGADLMLAAHVRQFMREPSSTQWLRVKSHGHSWVVALADSQVMKRACKASRAASLPGSVWSVTLPYDMESFLGPLDALIWLSIVLALALVLVMLGLGYLEARHIISPLQTLRRQADELAKGNLDVRASVRSRDEIGDLAEAFNQMAGRLRATYRNLEERLAENELRARHINVINEITGAIVQVLSLDSIFEILTRELGKILPHDALWMALFEEDGSILRVMHIAPQGLVSLFDGGIIPLAGSLHGHVINSCETVHAEIGPEQRDEFYETRTFRAEGFQSYLIAPLPARHRIIGTLTVASTAPDAFNDRLAPIMTSLAGAVAIAIEQTELFQRISHFANELESKVDTRTRELERATQKLIQTEKYFATGRMAGSLAHEINNPLGIIKNFLQLTKNNLRESGGGRRRSDPNLGNLEIMDEEVDRIARLVRQMLDLHRPVEQQVHPVDLNRLIEEILTLMQEDFEHGRIKIVRELAASLPRPVASPDLLRQVLINLIRNAQDAMEEGGVLTVRTSVVTDWLAGAEHQVIRIRIADTGCGISPECLSQIFDPFFTTKPPEKGTGLGLCVSFSIISMYRGNIDVQSAVGRGTAVIVSLPVETSDETAPETPTAEPLAGAGHLPPAGD